MENLVTLNAPFERFRFTWTIEHFSTWKKKQYSEIFTVGGYKWRLLIYPEGKGVDQLSLFLDVADSETLPSGWSKYAYFILAVVSQIHPKLTIKKETEHTFDAKASDWGYKSFIPLRDVHDPTKGYVVDDTLIVEAEVSAPRVVDNRAYDSRKQTDFVGSNNQGTTGQSEAVSPSGSSEAAGGKAREVGLHGQERGGEGLLERPGQCKSVEGTCERESLIVQHKGTVPEAPRGVVNKVMTVAQIANVLGDISRGLVPTDLEDPRWPSSAGEMTQTFAPMVRLADEFRALKGEVERLRTKAAILSEVMRLDGGQGGAGS